MFSRPWILSRTAITIAHRNLSNRAFVATKKVNMDGPPPRTFKIESKEFKSILSEDLLELSRVFVKHDYQLRIAGGAVSRVAFTELHSSDFIIIVFF